MQKPQESEKKQGNSSFDAVKLVYVDINTEKKIEQSKSRFQAFVQKKTLLLGICLTYRNIFLNLTKIICFFLNQVFRY